MKRGRQRPEVVYVERGGDSSAKWLFWGALLGAGLALLYAPQRGEETRRNLQRKLWKLRAMTEEKLDELAQQFAGGGRESPREVEEEDELEGDHEARGPARGPMTAARQELERRLAESRARRRPAPADVEEPLA